MKKLKLFKKLNSKGFAHHFLIPVIAIVAVAGIGAYVVSRSNAAITPVSVCGSGYSQIASKGVNKKGTTTEIARVYLLRKGNTLCAVNMAKAGAFGPKKPMEVRLFPRGSECSGGSGSGTNGSIGDYSRTNPLVDYGSYAYYAGPVKYVKNSTCILAGGNMSYGGEIYWSFVQLNVY